MPFSPHVPPSTLYGTRQMSIEPVSPTSDEPTSRERVSVCVMCKETIQAGARRCPHCSSFQNWQRYLTFSSVVMSWAIALISVLTVVVSVVTKIGKLEEENLQLRLLEVNHAEHYLLMWGSNPGKRPGVVRSASIEVAGVHPDTDGKWDLGVAREDAIQRQPGRQIVEAGPVIIEPGISQRLRLYSQAGELPELHIQSTGQRPQCKMRFEVLQFNGGIRTLDQAYTCY